MAGVRDAMIGVGSALRKAREKRRLSLEEASRDTKLTVGSLRALEEEDFDVLLGEPWVRGSLRTYAHYLGLSADKVAAAYARHADEPTPPPPPGKLGRVERAIAATRIRDNQRLMVIVAATIIVVAGVFGLVSRRSSTPPPASLGAETGLQAPANHSIEAALAANRDALITITVDAGRPTSYRLTAGETRSFEASTTLVLQIARGGTVHVVINGDDQGSPGKPGRPWEKRYSYTGAGPLTSPSG